MKPALTLSLLTWSCSVFGQAFITTWKTDNPGVSASNQITVPTIGGGYSYSIAWEQVGLSANKGTIPGPITGTHTVTFPSAGTYKVSITGSFPRIYFYGGYPFVDNLKLLTVEQWGSQAWTSMAYAFNGCQNLTVPAKDAPKLLQVTDMSFMFADCSIFNQPINHWDVRNINNMSNLFLSARSFNQPLNNWDVSKVTNMSQMFAAALSFNQPLNSWNVGNVVDMGSMFQAALNFNQPLEGWNVSNVTSMVNMFASASSFNQPFERWNVSKVTDMSGMFSNAVDFNQPLGNWDITNAAVARRMDYMLNKSGLNVTNYDQTLIGWATQIPSLGDSVRLGAEGLVYSCDGEVPRSQLIATRGWDIVGDSKTTQLPDPMVSIMQPVCFGNTGTILVSAQRVNDLFSFDNGITFQSDNTKSGLVPGTYFVIIKNNLGCISSPVSATINPSTTKPPLPAVSGSPVVCPNVTAVDYSASIQDYTYVWVINGGALLSQQNEKVSVNWGPTNFNASVKAIGFDAQSCPTDTVTFPVKIQIKLKPSIPLGMDSICYNFRAGVPYQTSYTNGSVYTWFTDGGVVSSGQTSPQATIDFTGNGKYSIWVKEESTTSTDYCEGFSDSLRVTVFEDLAAITLNFVSVDYNDDKKVQIQWDVSLLERISDLIIVSRRIAGSNAPWVTVATLEKNVQSFLDQHVSPDQNSYEYKVEGFNKCDEGLQTVIHNTIKLDGDKVEAQELIDLFWNDYSGWDGVERYEIWRKLDGDTTYRLIDITPGTITNYSGKHGRDGFAHTLRIKAKKLGENTISWSNEKKLDFENPIDFIPNVITPNGDDKNEYFVIPKLELYPENNLGIYDRDGTVVYQRRNYRNDWNAVGLPNGTYYYMLRLERNGTMKKGWVQVIR